MTSHFVQEHARSHIRTLLNECGYPSKKLPVTVLARVDTSACRTKCVEGLSRSDRSSSFHITWNADTFHDALLFWTEDINTLVDI